MNLGIVHGRSVGLELSLDDLQKVSDEVPFLADLKPSDKYVLEDVHKIGGTPAVIRYLLELGYLGGDCMTVTGKKMAENAQSYPRLPDGQVGTGDFPLKRLGSIYILTSRCHEWNVQLV
ncbi:dihydroxy-acid dehydratase, chloroplastic-like [Hibiscus syriacus]|uniref:dihydroxy-acid dehydratase, chloroplastic-like n=1 Tax=Hibiscus syriacus TaxID=106335 RepID=UPI0019247FE3|nr:dihydroxy-acid dehydratase, chloroplastic-like [Hibiscus syriacus]